MTTRLSSGGIIANYRCPAACGHCLYGCSPSAEPGYMDEPTAVRVCGQLRRLGCPGVHIGGGEPFLNVDGLVTLCQAIIASGLSLEYIETNGAWITGDDARDRRNLATVTRAGGGAPIMVSADPFHVEFVPFWKPKKLIRLLEETGVSYFVWQQRYLPLLSKLDPMKTYTGAAMAEVLGHDVISQCASEYGMRFNGRALNLHRKFGKKKPASEWLQPCGELRNTSHFHVDYLGCYVPPGCTGMGILIDDLDVILRNWDKPLDPMNYPVLSRLLAGGTGSLLSYARTFGYEPDPAGYVSKCDLCFHIRKFLFHHARPTPPDLTPGSFYNQNY
ncbi:MAG: radical SAM protein [Phycisphaerae bacterium]|nr:radical SAM protein [Phycisphaerae bacterium]